MRFKDNQLKISESVRKSHCTKELKLLKSLKHPNIITPLGVIVQPEQKTCFNVQIRQHLLLPYYQKTCLETYIHKFYPPKRGGNNIFHTNEATVPEEEITMFDLVSIAWQVASALEYLKGMEITHRDVAMRNVLISNNKVCKITDFERAKKGETTRKISIEKKIKEILKAHMSKDIPKEYPNECLKGVYYYYSSEVYCFGRLMLCLFSFMKPCDYGRIYPPIQPENCPKAIYDLIVDCINENRKSRPSISSCKDVLSTVLKHMDHDEFLKLKQTLIDEVNRNIVEEHFVSQYTQTSHLFL